jgi:hypothetical protein
MLVLLIIKISTNKPCLFPLLLHNITDRVNPLLLFVRHFQTYALYQAGFCALPWS